MCQSDSGPHPSALHTRSKALLVSALFILALLTTPWLTLPYSRLDWVAFSQPYEPTPTATTTPAFDYLPLIARNRAPAPTSTPSAGPLPLVRISALQYSGRDEYIEIVNEGAAQNLTGWSILSVRGNQRYAFPDEYALGPGVTVRVHSGPDAANNPPGDLLWTTDHIWNNDGDKAELYDSSERLIDSRCYNAGCP